MKTFKQLVIESEVSAEDKYNHHKKQALRHLQLLKTQIETLHQHAHKGKVDWSHVGSMESFHHNLRDLNGSGND